MMSKPLPDPLRERILSAECLRLHQQLADIKRQEGPSDNARRVAQCYIESVYAYQRCKFGRVRVHVNVASLLR